MTQRPARLALAPDPPEPWRTSAEIQAHFGMSHDLLERHVRDGMPHLDVAHHDERRRRRRAFRFRISVVQRWLEVRR
jgi:hypothetical protein